MRLLTVPAPPANEEGQQKTEGHEKQEVRKTKRATIFHGQNSLMVSAWRVT
jgi:hypothetical protein